MEPESSGEGGFRRERDPEVGDGIRAKFQIARISRCDACGQGWQHADGRMVAIGPAALARAACHAVEIGSVDGDEAGRARQSVPPRIERLVWHRDQGRCQVPGCRAARYLEIHHIVHREDGGTHDPWNLTLLCAAHHIAHHRGLLTIAGRAPDQLVIERLSHVDPEGASGIGGMAHAGWQPAPGSEASSAVGRAPGTEPPSPVEPGPARGPVGMSHAGLRMLRSPAAYPDRPSRLALATKRVEARAGLVELGWKSKDASAAVDAAISRLGPEAALEKILFEALRGHRR